MEYALEGSVFVGGAVVQWLRDELHFITESVDSEYFAAKVPDSGGVYVVPAFTGLGAPHWDMHARGSIFGLTRGAGKDHIIRAALESIAYQTEDVLAAMQDDMTDLGDGSEGVKGIASLKVDGGASRNRLLLQFQSDVSNLPVIRPATTEATALGAAFLAGLAVGFFGSREELSALLSSDGMTFTPRMSADDRTRLLDGWNRAVKACRAF
jgi:glycerol kinase